MTPLACPPCALAFVSLDEQGACPACGQDSRITAREWLAQRRAKPRPPAQHRGFLPAMGSRAASDAAEA